MANYLLIVPHIYAREGGLSKNTTDPASKNPVPDGSGYHTNKGITWLTFSSNATKLGLPLDIQLWYKMPEYVWQRFFKQLYWNKIQGDKINSQAIAEMFADGTFIGGGHKQIRAVQNHLNTKGYQLAADGVAGPMTVEAINKYASTAAKEKELLDIAFNAQMAHFQSLSTWSTFGRGWAARFESLYNQGLQYLKDNPVAAILPIILVSALAFFFN
jgi:lysozyme family protein